MKALACLALRRASESNRSLTSALLLCSLVCVSARVASALERQVCSAEDVEREKIPKERASLEAACGRGDWGACVRAGSANLYAADTDFERAGALYAHACNGGDAEGCTALGGLQSAGLLKATAEGAAADAYLHASSLYRTACGLKQAEACFGLAQMLEAGQARTNGSESVAALRAKAESLYQSGCAKGSGKACAALGAFYLPNDVNRRNERGAVRAFQKGCKLGEPSSCAYLGGALLQGSAVVARDVRAAILHYARACEAGDVSSCAFAADLYARDGSKTDWPAAVRLYEKGCDLGSLDSCYALAQIYQEGNATRRDPRRAAELFKLACLGGCRTACRSDASVVRDK
jgi:uncharacterized protein